ncbi:glycosyltransferase family 1 protein [Vibrio sp. La 4.2.2]|uniref:glycosyltransferase family 4 protein n=1 Tax=Vibrio sp. La 4.2.2 TaxID=2998830 RepID=UPI0022CE2E8B|nr:glycosyltransferase family 1 protein [Vibrio sp. La 4.2.2]MDA0110526.1 glycosyltransferase family 1 protein [Vibrio sp. La 4.2.2]
MKRIAIDARPLSDKLTGIGRYLNEVLREIFEQDRINQYYLYSSKPLLIDFSGYANVRVVHCNTKHKLIDFLISQTLFPIWCLRDKINVYWSPRHHLPMMLSLNKTIKKVVTIHDIVWFKHPSTMNRSGLLLERMLFKPSVRQSNTIITLSKFTKKELINELNVNENKITTTGAGSFVNECSLQGNYKSHFFKSASIPYFLFVGTLEPRKNLHNIILAFHEFSKKNKEVNLVLVGKDGWGDLKISDLISRYNLEDRVEQCGFVSDDQLKQLYENCHTLLMPSIYEGYGFPALEALALKKNVIVSKHSAIAEIHGDNILISETDNVSIHEALLQTLDIVPTNHAKIVSSWKIPAKLTLNNLLG